MDIRIAICEDSETDAHLLHKYITQYFEAGGRVSFSIKTYASGMQLLGDFSPGAFDIVFVDIYLKCEDGVDISRELRSVDPMCMIVFETRSMEHAIEAFAVNAVHYITKPLDYTPVAEALRRCEVALSRKSTYIMLRGDRNIQKVFLSDILYIEVYNNISIVHLKTHSLETRMPLKKIESEIAQTGTDFFLRTHRSYLVNMHYISEVQRDAFLLKSGDVVLISKYHTKQLIREYEAFLLRETRQEAMYL